MSFLDKLKEKAGIAAQAAGAAAQTAVEQTKTAAAIGKLKLSIAAQEDKIKKAYTELGRLVYLDYTEGTEPAVEEYQLWYDNISAAKAEIATLEAEIEALKAPAEEVVAEEPAVVIDLGAEEPEEIPVEDEAAEEPAEESAPEEAPVEEAPVEVVVVDVPEEE